MPARVESNAREVAGALVSLRRQFVQGPLALGVGEYLIRVVTRAKTKGYGFTDRTGTLRSSIKTLGVRVDGTRVLGRAGTSVVYARRVEFVADSRYSYLRRAVTELGERELVESIDRHVIPWIRRQGFAPSGGRGGPLTGGALGGP